MFSSECTGIKTQRLKVLNSICKKCYNCNLSQTKKNIVFGEGPVSPKFMSVAESPGKEEDVTGRPFQGKSGKLYRQCLIAIGLNPEKDVYMANILKCHPPDNRVPESSEITECIKYLKKQIEIINPKLILLLGRTAVKGLLPEFQVTPMDRLRRISKNNQVIYRTETLTIPALVTYHPSALLYDSSKKFDFKEDFLYLKSVIPF